MAARKKAASAALVKTKGELAPGDEKVSAFTKLITTEANKSLEFCEAMTVKTAAEREFASNALATIAREFDEWDGQRKDWTEDLKRIASSIDKVFRPALQALKRCETLCKSKIGTFDVAQAQERRKLLQESLAAAASGDQAAAERAYETADAHAPAGTGAGSKLVWDGEVIDAAAIPREYLIPDVAKLEAMTRALDRDPQIPGWRAFQTADVRTSRKGVA